MKALMIVALLLLATSSHAKDEYGNVHCQSPSGTECYLEWDMSSTPRSEYVLERFDVESRAWRLHTALPSGVRGGSYEELPGGTLFRIRGCDDLAKRISCVSSVVMWVPFFATSIEQLPDAVTLQPHGHKLKVHKNDTLYAANLDYNVGLLMNVVGTIKPEDVTPMTHPPVRISPGDSPDPEIVSSMTEHMFLHNEIYGLWERLVSRTNGAGH